MRRGTHHPVGRTAVAGWLATLVVLLACFAPAAVAAPGELDPGFGDQGHVEITPAQPAGGYAYPQRMAIGPHDEIFVAVSYRKQQPCVGSTPCDGIAVRRYGADGTFESEFAPDQLAGTPYISLSAIAIDEQGRVVVAATAADRVQLVRLAPDGAVDRTFGDDGRVELRAEGVLESPRLAIVADGGIVVAARVVRWFEPSVERRYTPDRSYLTLYRLSSEGAPEASFGGGDGVVAFNSPKGDELGALGVVAGQIVISAGVEPQCCGILEPRLLRFGATGELLADQRFAALDSSDPFAGPILARRGGGFWVGGSKEEESFLAAFKRNWRRDARIGTHGFVRLRRLALVSLVEDSRGRLALVGQVRGHDASGYKKNWLSVARRRADGRPDRTFAGGRPVPVPFPGFRVKNGSDHGLAVQSDGRIVMLVRSQYSCFRSCSTPDYFLIRFRGGVSRARCHGRRATIVGTHRSERLVGTRGSDVIAALGGNDRVFGRGGDDIICGGRGNDRLYGGRGRDRLFGGRGRDLLVDRSGRVRQHS